MFVAAWIGVSMFSAPLLGQELRWTGWPRGATTPPAGSRRTIPKGSNQNFWVIAPGETRVPVREITGPGSIVHFRDNITSDVPHHLQLHVLRRSRLSGNPHNL